jgi:hypothetical protein
MAGRPRQFDDPAHAKLRERVARHRKRKAAELAARSQQRSLAAGKRRSTKARWRVVERSSSTPRGETADVLLIRDGEDVPGGYAASAWLPRGLLPFHLARKLAATRRRQIREWLAEQGA